VRLSIPDNRERWRSFGGFVGVVVGVVVVFWKGEEEDTFPSALRLSSDCRNVW
jgi:hypothetical protein